MAGPRRGWPVICSVRQTPKRSGGRFRLAAARETAISAGNATRFWASAVSLNRHQSSSARGRNRGRNRLLGGRSANGNRSRYLPVRFRLVRAKCVFTLVCSTNLAQKALRKADRRTRCALGRRHRIVEDARRPASPCSSDTPTRERKRNGAPLTRSPGSRAADETAKDAGEQRSRATVASPLAMVQ